MRLKDIPNLRLTTAEKRMVALVVNEVTYHGQEVVTLNNWNLLPAVPTLHTIEAAIDHTNHEFEELAILIRIVMKVTEFVDDA